MKITNRDKTRIEQYKRLFQLATRAFYSEKEIVVMDAFLQAYFGQYFVETYQLVMSTKLPHKWIRQSLYSLSRAKLIEVVSRSQLARDPFIREGVRNYIERKNSYFGNDERVQHEFWRLNPHAKGALFVRIKSAEAEMERDFEDFDQFAKVCLNAYCGREFKSEEYLLTNGRCSFCGGSLDFKHKVDKLSGETIKSRKNAAKLFRLLFIQFCLRFAVATRILPD